MRGHLAFLSMLNAVSHFDHQDLSRYCRTLSLLELVVSAHDAVQWPFNGGKSATLLTSVALYYSVYLIHSKNNLFKVVTARRLKAISQGKSTKRSRLEIHRKVRPAEKLRHALQDCNVLMLQHNARRVCAC